MLVRVHLLIRDPPLQRRLRRALSGLDVLVSADAGEGPVDPAAVQAAPADLLVVREDLVGPDLDVLANGQGGAGERPAVVVLTRSSDAGHRTRLLGRGVSAVLGEREDVAMLKAAFEEIVAHRAETMVLAHKARGTSRHGRLEDFVAKSPRMERFVATVRKIIPQDTTVLLTGETGVGKERLARVIHHEGPRSSGPFVAVNCAALPENLLESELFGHEKGAFTDAVREKRGKFELAHRGTVFLDEIGDMPLHLQTKLLRVLQEREVERIGAEEPIPIDVRIVAATNTDLKAAMEAKTFRADLFYRLSVVTLTIPPLRERTEDVPYLVETYVARYSERFNRPGLVVDPPAMDALVAYAWPGNVRELMNVVERAVLLASGPSITPDDLPEEVASAPAAHPAVEMPQAAPSSREPDQRLDLLPDPPEALLEEPLVTARERLISRFEPWYLTGILRQTEGRIGEAARRMGIDPRSLYEKLKRYGIDKKDFR